VQINPAFAIHNASNYMLHLPVQTQTHAMHTAKFNYGDVSVVG